MGKIYRQMRNRGDQMSLDIDMLRDKAGPIYEYLSQLVRHRCHFITLYICLWYHPLTYSKYSRRSYDVKICIENGYFIGILHRTNGKLHVNCLISSKIFPNSTLWPLEKKKLNIIF